MTVLKYHHMLFHIFHFGLKTAGRLPTGILTVAIVFLITRMQPTLAQILDFHARAITLNGQVVILQLALSLMKLKTQQQPMHRPQLHRRLQQQLMHRLPENRQQQQQPMHRQPKYRQPTHLDQQRHLLMIIMIKMTTVVVEKCTCIKVCSV